MTSDQMAAAEAEHTGEALSFPFRETSFDIPGVHEVLWRHWTLLDSDLTEGITELLGPQAEKFWEMDPTVMEVLDLKSQLVAVYTGAFVGEVNASAPSSQSAGSKSRRPSPGRTRTSPKATSA